MYCLKSFLTLQEKKSRMKTVTILHLYYQDLWKEFWELIKPTISEESRLIITLPEHHREMVVKYESISPFIKCRVYPNYGADIRPFLLVVKELLENGEDISAVVKLHTKKSIHSHNSSNFGEFWRKSLYTDLLLHKDYLLQVLKEDPEVGMIAKKDWFVYEPKDSTNYEVEKEGILSAARLFNLNVDKLNYHYVTGTMFIASFTYLKELLTNSNLSEILEKTQEEHTPSGTLAHGIERIFSYGLNTYNKKIILI